MLKCLYILAMSYIIQAAEDVKCNSDGLKMRHPYILSRYFECTNFSWITKTCSGDEIFDHLISECTKADISRAETINIPEDNNGIADKVIDVPEFLVVNETSQNAMQPEMYFTKRIEDATEANTVSLTTEEVVSETTTDEIPQEQFEPNITEIPEKSAVVRKSISEKGSGKLNQELGDDRIRKLTGPPLNTKTMKTKANWTTSVLNGAAVYTDISYYQSHGRSYTFRVPGGLPAEQNQVISWIRENSHKYPQIEIIYDEEEEQLEDSDSFPTGLPLKCGTKFLDKLSGGKATPIEDNPWQVAVLRRTDSTYVCGGAVITRRHVLSAAHCFRQRNRHYGLRDIILRVGDYDKEVREESQVDYSVIEMLVHEGYQEKKHTHDIVIMSTSDNIPFSSHIYPICLPPSNAEYTPGHKCTVSGWGQVESEDVPTRYLRSGEVTIISKSECRKKTIFSKGVPIEIFCAEDPTKSGVDTCLGDSGGPFACNYSGVYYLYGITAFGSYPCGQDIPSFYTNVSHYREWIISKINKTL